MKIPIGQALGYVIGVLVLFPLLLYGVNKIFFSAREVTDRQISQYINNSIKIKDIPKNNHLSFEEERKDKSLGYRTKSITHFLDRIGKGQQQYYTYTYLSQKYKKYFCLIVTNEGHKTVLDSEDKELEMTINKKDWENPAYGTKENPIPVLKFIGVERSLRNNNLDYDKAYMDDVYRRNVEIYLKHIIPKEEFKRRFEK